MQVVAGSEAVNNYGSALLLPVIYLLVARFIAMTKFTLYQATFKYNVRITVKPFQSNSDRP